MTTALKEPMVIVIESGSDEAQEALRQRLAAYFNVGIDMITIRVEPPKPKLSMPSLPEISKATQYSPPRNRKERRVAASKRHR